MDCSFAAMNKITIEPCKNGWVVTGKEDGASATQASVWVFATISDIQKKLPELIRGYKSEWVASEMADVERRWELVPCKVGGITQQDLCGVSIRLANEEDPNETTVRVHGYLSSMPIWE